MLLAPAPGKRKRGRPPKQHSEESKMQTLEMSEEEAAKKAKRALNRFNGMSVAEVMAKTLPDVITYNLDILIVSYLMLMHVFILFLVEFFQLNCTGRVVVVVNRRLWYFVHPCTPVVEVLFTEYVDVYHQFCCHDNTLFSSDWNQPRTAVGLQRTPLPQPRKPLLYVFSCCFS